MKTLKETHLTNFITLTRTAATAAFATLIAAAAIPARAASASYEFTATINTSSETYLGNISVGGTTPAKITEHGSVSMNGFDCSITIPKFIIQEMTWLGAKSLKVKITQFDMNSSDADATTVNAAGAGIDLPAVNIAANQAMVFKFPATAAKISSWTSTKKGTMNFCPGTIRITVSTETFNMDMTCAPYQSQTIISKTSVD
ncbi:MAG TPA: hypothetical protein VGO59_15655 [Verrucomicrobiae bacterium]|jgi:hypothetical protein